jgi:hypothetical protein
MIYAEIRIKGKIDETWSSWFADLEVTHTEEGETLLAGELEDQAAIYGVIAKLRDLGLTLVSVDGHDVES